MVKVEEKLRSILSTLTFVITKDPLSTHRGTTNTSRKEHKNIGALSADRSFVCLFVCLFAWGFSFPSRIFHSYGDVTISVEGCEC